MPAPTLYPLVTSGFIPGNNVVSAGGSFYYGDSNTSYIKKISSNGTVTTFYASPYDTLNLFGVSPAQNALYATTYAEPSGEPPTSSIVAFNLITAEKVTIYSITDETYPVTNVVQDSAGNLYYGSNQTTIAIYKIDAELNKTVFANISSICLAIYPTLSLDNDGNMYVGCLDLDNSTYKIIEIQSDGTILDNLITGISTSITNGFTYNVYNGNIYIAEGENMMVYSLGDEGWTGTLYFTIGEGTSVFDPIFDSDQYLNFSAYTNAALTKVFYTTNPQDIICFNEGTKILCSIGGKEEYVKIEDIAVGTLVKTLKSGYKKLEYIGSRTIHNPGESALEPSLENLYICRPSNYPELTEDLILTGAHSILVNTVTDEQRKKSEELVKHVYVTEGKYRLISCLDPRAARYTVQGLYTVWHLALEHEDKYMNYGIYANGLLVETASKRMMVELSGMKLK